MKVVPKNKEFTAYRWIGCITSREAICKAEPSLHTDYIYQDDDRIYCWHIKTDRGSTEVKSGDIIIKNKEGNFQVMPYHIFRDLFDIKET